MFQSPKIQIIASMPEGDAILLIWVRLLCLAGQVNDGGKIYLAENVPYTDEMLSTVFGKPAAIIRLAIETFRKFRMIELLEDGALSLCNWEKYQSEDKLAEIREQTRERVRKCRERKQLAENAESADRNATSNATVTSRNALDKNRIDTDTEEIESARNKSCTNVKESAREERTQSDLTQSDLTQSDQTQSDQPKAPARKVKWYGSFKNVALTDEEYAALKGQAENREALIEDLSAYKASTNRQYANDYAALLRTEERRRARQKQYGKKQPVGAPSYDIAAFEAQGFDLPPVGGGDGNG